MRHISLLGILFISFLSSACYLDLGEPEQHLVEIPVSVRSSVGDSGDGYYIVVKLYSTEAMEEMINSETISYMPPQSIAYDSVNLSEPLLVSAEYLGAGLSSFVGSVKLLVMKGISQRVLIEQWRVSSGGDFPVTQVTIEYAGITEAFSLEGAELELSPVLLSQYIGQSLPN